MKDKTTQIFVDAVGGVLSSLAGADVTQRNRVDTADTVTLGDLTGVIDMSTDTQSAAMAIGFSEQLAVALTNKALGTDMAEVNDDVENFVGEMTNMICGAVKASLQDEGIDVGFASPSLLKGKGQVVSLVAEATPSVLTLDTAEGELYLMLTADY
jgi:chemotaxis protein CheX